MFRFKEVQIKFADIFRVFISGSSSAGKTYFAQKFLHENLFNFKRIYYFHPDFHETAPFLEYKIQCLDLESSVFKIHIYDKDKNKIKNSIKGVYLTLVITDARIQYIYSRKTN